MKKSVLALLIPTLLSGCASGSLRFAGAKSEAIEFGNREATQVKLECPQTTGGEGGGSAAIISAGIGIAVDTLLGSLSAVLEKAKKARTAVWTAGNEIPLNGCRSGTLTITRGVFSGKTGNVLEKPDFYPSFVFKAEVNVTEELIPGKSATALVSIKPTSLDYSETAALDRGKKRKEVTVSFAFGHVGEAPVTPSAAGGKKGDGDEKAAASADTGSATLLNLGRLEIGRKYNFNNLSGATSVPLTAKHNLAVVVTESEDASVALEALAGAFESNKGDLGKALKDALGKAISGDSK